MAKTKLTLEEAAEYLGTSTDEIMHSRWQGQPPGRLGFKEGGVLYFKRTDLPKPPAAKGKGKAAEVEAEDGDN